MNFTERTYRCTKVRLAFLAGALIAIAGCSVPSSMHVRKGIDPNYADDDVRFRTTYYFRVFDACYQRNPSSETDWQKDNVISGKTDGPFRIQNDSLYRFHMTGKASALGNKINFESGTLKKEQIDPFGAKIVADRKTGDLSFQSQEETQRRAIARREQEDLAALTELRKQMADLPNARMQVDDLIKQQLDGMATDRGAKTTTSPRAQADDAARAMSAIDPVKKNFADLKFSDFQVKAAAILDKAKKLLNDNLGPLDNLKNMDPESDTAAISRAIKSATALADEVAKNLQDANPAAKELTTSLNKMKEAFGAILKKAAGDNGTINLIKGADDASKSQQAVSGLEDISNAAKEASASSAIAGKALAEIKKKIDAMPAPTDSQKPKPEGAAPAAGTSPTASADGAANTPASADAKPSPVTVLQAKFKDADEALKAATADATKAGDDTKNLSDAFNHWRSAKNVSDAAAVMATSATGLSTEKTGLIANWTAAADATAKSAGTFFTAYLDTVKVAFAADKETVEEQKKAEEAKKDSSLHAQWTDKAKAEVAAAIDFQSNAADASGKGGAAVQKLEELAKRASGLADQVDKFKSSLTGVAAPAAQSRMDYDGLIELGKKLAKATPALVPSANEALALARRVQHEAGRKSAPSNQAASNDTPQRQAGCPEGFVSRRGFQILGPEGWRTFDQDERLIMAMSSSASPLISTLQEVSGRVLNAQSSASEVMLPLVNERLRIVNTERRLDTLKASPPQDSCEAVARLITAFGGNAKTCGEKIKP